MKKIFLYSIIAFNSVVLFAQNALEYTITGTLPDNIHNSYAYLSPYLTDGLMPKDSALISHGHFIFKGIAADKPALYNITTENASMNGWVIIEPGTIQYLYQNNKDRGYVCTRGTSLNDYLTDSVLIPAFQLDEILKEMVKTDFANKSTELAEQTRSLSKRFYMNLMAVIKGNIENPAGESLFLMYSQAFKEKERNEILPLLSEQAKQKYDDMITQANAPKTGIAEGQTYINFTGKTPNNGQFLLSDIISKKKLVLLDFWASWCVPCIKSMPEITALYDNYRDKGLEIVGISLDENEAFWKTSMEKNNMSWIQIISGKSPKDDIAKLYGVRAIPCTVLIDGKGTIVAVNIRGEALADKIKNTLE
jgi:thiol-disulfide isomerase/thioredoxin